MEPFISMILPWPGNYAPRGWAFCRGQIIAISQNQTLFSLLGTNYGGDGVTNFGLPDLQGRTPVGAGLYPGLPEFRLGSMGGIPIIELDVDNMPKHKHSITTGNVNVSIGVDAANDANTQTPSSSTVLGKAVTVGGVVRPINAYSDQAATDTLGGLGFSGDFDVGYTGAGGGFENYAPYLTINYIIALDGIYPSRP